MHSISAHTPLLMEGKTQDVREDIIDIKIDGNCASGSSNDARTSLEDEERVPSTSSNTERPTDPSTTVNGRASAGGDDGHGLSDNLWNSSELVVTLVQIVAAIVVLTLSKDEHPQKELFTWVIGYTCGCIATLPILCWRFWINPQRTGQDSSQSVSSAYVPNNAVSLIQTPDEENNTDIVRECSRIRINAVMDFFKMMVEFFFVVWFMGFVWIYDSISSPDHASSQLYWLSMGFLSFSCIRYGLYIITFAMICYFLPGIICVVVFGGVIRLVIEVSKALSACFLSSNEKESTLGSGYYLLGSGDDGYCCICLGKCGEEEGVLRKLPCSHVFHVECLNKWLQIKAICPLCLRQVRRLHLQQR